MSTDPTARDGSAAGEEPATGGTPGTSEAPGTAGTPAVDGSTGAEEAQEAGPAVMLGPRDRDVLAFERQWWRYGGAKEEAIRERFGLSATRYYQVLNAVIDRPEALATDPLLVRRLRRLRSARQRRRSGRVLGSEGLRG